MGTDPSVREGQWGQSPHTTCPAPVLTARIARSLSTRSASWCSNWPRLRASNRRHGDPRWKAACAASTALSTSGCEAKQQRQCVAFHASCSGAKKRGAAQSFKATRFLNSLDDLGAFKWFFFFNKDFYKHQINQKYAKEFANEEDEWSIKQPKRKSEIKTCSWSKQNLSPQEREACHLPTCPVVQNQP